MHELSPDKIIKALECISGKTKDRDCDNCSFNSAFYCSTSVPEAAIDLILKLQGGGQRKYERKEII